MCLRFTENWYYKEVFTGNHRYQIEVCLQLRHAKIHYGIEPEGDDRKIATNMNNIIIFLLHSNNSVFI
jgi:hypothetical protein